jgi:hypothetical protein
MQGQHRAGPGTSPGKIFKVIFKGCFMTRGARPVGDLLPVAVGLIVQRRILERLGRDERLAVPLQLVRRHTL